MLILSHKGLDYSLVTRQTGPRPSLRIDILQVEDKSLRVSSLTAVAGNAMQGRVRSHGCEWLHRSCAAQAHVGVLWWVLH